MINEEKIKLMTKLALYEQGEGKKSIKSDKYYKKDYVGLMMINTAITVTIGYFMLVFLWFVYKINYFVENIVSMNVVNLGIKLLVVYIIILIAYLLIAYVVYSMKYLKQKDMNIEYGENLKQLYLEYKKEEKQRTENRLGGYGSDDENTGI